MSRQPKVAIRPRTSDHNRYVDLFAAAFEDAGWDVAALDWRIRSILTGRLMILHWPDEFFSSPDVPSLVRSWARIVLMFVSRRIWGVRWIWVVHNLSPHDRDQGDTRLWGTFTSQLDGLVFLSKASRRAFAADHPDRAGIPHVTTRHGEYRTGAVTPPQPWRRPTQAVRLQFTGQIRPYKNLGALVDAARELDAGTALGIAGFASADHASALRRYAGRIPSLHLDLRSVPMAEVELERVVDASDAVILPYRQILNSGAALFALSRNRPVIAPALGALVELREAVGADWVYLYDGELTSRALRDAARWVRETDRQLECRLDRHDWGVVGPEVVRFAEGIAGGAGRSADLGAGPG